MNRTLICRFFDEVDGILAEVENPLIGVICTYGTNRNGYMICRYLIERFEWTPDEAILTFNDARGYPITREQNLRRL
jgi:atypical dual specificity phosphatase